MSKETNTGTSRLEPARRPLARSNNELTTSQRAAVERLLGLVATIREQPRKYTPDCIDRRPPGLCNSALELDRILGWEEIEQPSWINVLAIIGGRAYGKTTALMTLLERLRYPRRGRDKESADGGKVPEGHTVHCDIVLPPIDPEMFNGTPEFVLSWVFARLEPLLEELECRLRTPICVEGGHRRMAGSGSEELTQALKRTRENFEKVKGAIALLSARYSDKAIQLAATRAEFQGEVFEQQKAGLELRHHIHSFFDCLFEALDRWTGSGSGRKALPLLIVPFDDIDLAVERAPQLLHAVHSYLSHPRVVTILLGEWSAFALALHREHARGEFNKALFPQDDRLEQSVQCLVDAALLKYLQEQNIAELNIHPDELFKKEAGDEKPSLKDLLKSIDEALRKDAPQEAVSTAPLTSLFFPGFELPTLPNGVRLDLGEMRARYVEVLGRDLRSFNAFYAAFSELEAALCTEPAPPDAVRGAIASLKGCLARSARKSEITAVFEDVLRHDPVLGAEVLDLGRLEGLAERLAREDFDKLALAVLLYVGLYRILRPSAELPEIRMIGASAGVKNLWRSAFARPVWPWLETRDLPWVGDPGRGALIVTLATAMLEWLGGGLHLPAGETLSTYLGSDVAGNDPLARMLVRAVLVLAALQSNPATAVQQIVETGDSSESGGESSSRIPSRGSSTGNQGPMEVMGHWILAACPMGSGKVRELLSPEWYLSGMALYRRAEVITAHKGPLGSYRDPIMKTWFWRLLVTGAAEGPADVGEKRNWLAGLLNPIARGTAHAETMHFPDLLAVFVQGFVELSMEDLWMVTGRGYDFLAQVREEKANQSNGKQGDAGPGN